MAPDLETLRRAFEADPKDARVLDALARGLARLGREVEAFELLVDHGALERGDPLVHELAKGLAAGQRQALRGFGGGAVCSVQAPFPWAQSTVELAPDHPALDCWPLFSLSLNHPFADDAMLGALRPLPALRRLELGSLSERVTDEGLKTLTAHSNLETIDFRSRAARFSFEGVAGLSSLRRLQRLRFGRLPDQPGGFSQLAALPALRGLGLEGCAGLDDEDFRGIARLSKLRSLTISSEDLAVTSAGLESLAQLTELEDVVLRFGQPLESVFLERLASRCQLRALSLSQVSGDRWLEAANRWHSSLESLSIRPGSLESLAPQLQSFTALERLEVSPDAAVSRGGVEALASLPSLRDLELSGGLTYGEALAGLTELAGLKKLAFSTSHGYFEARLPPLPELRRLAVYSPLDMNPALLESFRFLPALIELGLSGLEELAADQAAVLASAPCLESLDLSGGCRVGPESLKTIGSAPAIRTLVLNGCSGVTARGLRALAALPGLENLGLATCRQLADEGDQVLDVLASFPKLRLLDLRRTGLSFRQASERLPHLRFLL